MVVDLLPGLPLLPRHLFLTAMREERFHWVIPGSPGAGVPWLPAPPELTAKPPSDASGYLLKFYCQSACNFDPLMGLSGQSTGGAPAERSAITRQAEAAREGQWTHLGKPGGGVWGGVSV